MKYSGTTLVSTENADEINRAILALLEKINELLARIEALENAQNN